MGTRQELVEVAEVTEDVFVQRELNLLMEMTLRMEHELLALTSED